MAGGPGYELVVCRGSRVYARPRARGHTSPSPRRRVDQVWSRRPAKGQGEGSVRTTKPAPSEYPHATALGKFAAPRQNPHVLPPGFGVDPPEGWVDWVWLIGYKRGGCAKEMKRAELALNEERRHRVVCFHCYKSPEQEAKSQQIVGQSLLSCVQYPVT